MKKHVLAMCVGTSLTMAACGTNDSNGTTTDTTEAETPGPMSFGSLETSSQLVSPTNQVTIDEVVSVNSGWVVVQEDNGFGEPGRPIGFAAVANGSNTSVTVTLDRDAVHEETLFAIVNVDAGEAGTFEFPGPDGPALGEAGSVLTSSFVVTFDPMVTASEQTLTALDEVTIDEVVSRGAGWLAVRAEREEDAVGELLGFARVTNGTTSDVTVSLERAIVHEETLNAVLHTDTGAIGTFEFDGSSMLDAPVLDANDEPLSSSFVVKVTPSVRVMDQAPEDPRTVFVEAAVSPGPGWIVVHEQDEDAIGAMLGFSALASGENTEVSVTLDREVVVGETLYAMLHTDDGVIGTFEFDATSDADAPVNDMQGEAIAPSFEIVSAQ